MTKLELNHVIFNIWVANNPEATIYTGLYDFSHDPFLSNALTTPYDAAAAAVPVGRSPSLKFQLHAWQTTSVINNYSPTANVDTAPQIKPPTPVAAPCTP